MTSRARWVVALAALVMAAAYVFPLWRVELIAPQYPEGLGMYILVDGVKGFTEYDLNNINNLNHYIGMKAIEPDAIPELRYMPWILAGLIAGGLLVAAVGRRVPLNVFGGILALVLLAGLADFWRWGYDYGHNLDHEMAIIKIPGMSYQPPLIGSKRLLNFRATSWPALGGIALSLGAVMVAFAMFDSRRRRAGVAVEPAGPTPSEADAAASARADTFTTADASRRSTSVALLLALSVSASACGPSGPRELIAGEEQCQFCRMEISDRRFGTQVVLRTGKVLVFDSVECLAGFVRGNDEASIRGIWVADAGTTGDFVRAAEAGYLVDGSLRGPMGRAIAFATPADATRERERLGGFTVSWAALLADSAGIVSHDGH